MQYRQDELLYTASGVNYYVNSNHRKYITKFAADCLRFGKFPSQFCESCGTTYRQNYETFSAL